MSDFYDQIDEDSRLKKTRHGQLEFAITMRYIHKFAGKEPDIENGERE